MTSFQATAHDGSFNVDRPGSKLLWSRHQIVQLFRRFISGDHPVSVHYADEDRIIVTRALQLDPNLDRVYFEYGDHKAGNSDLLRSKEVQFSVENGAGKSQFISPRVRDVLLEGKPVFHIPIPEHVVQADRRMHQRITIPHVSAPVVQFNLPDGRKAEGRLADMSDGGIGVIGLAADLKVPSGTVIRDCRIQLNDKERLYVDLKIRHANVVMGADNNLMHRVGFSLASRPKKFAELLKAFTVDL
jgi:c-di-GMP-binding flagellar brake protein YcgR